MILFSGWLRIWAWGHDRNEPNFSLAIDEAWKCCCCPVLQLCGQNTTLCSFVPKPRRHIFNRNSFVSTEPANVWLMFSFTGSCSSYSLRNNGVFLTVPQIWMRREPVLLQWCHLTEVSGSLHLLHMQTFLEGKRREWKKHTAAVFSTKSLSKRSIVSFSYHNICQIKPPNCLWFGNLCYIKGNMFCFLFCYSQ